MIKRAKSKPASKAKRKAADGDLTPSRGRKTPYTKERLAGLQPAWEPGQSSNPAGRPLGARSRLSEAFIATVAAEFDRRGTACLRQLDARDFVQVVVALVPRSAKIDGTIAALRHEDALDALELIERAEGTGGHVLEMP